MDLLNWTLLGTAVALLLLFLHPFVTYPLSLLAVRVLSSPGNGHAAGEPRQEGGLPSISVCFCGYNEEAVIAEKIRNIEAAAEAYPGRVEVFMYCDGCSDRTFEIAVDTATFTTVIEGSERAGKSTGMNKLASRSTGELLVFTDANTMLAPGALEALGAAMTDQRVGVASGRSVLTNSRDGHVANVGSLYWRLEETIKRLETETGSTMGADGALFAIRRHLFREVPADIIDDMFTSLSILCDGYRVVSVPGAIAYEKSSTDGRDEFRRKVRIACRSFNCHRLLFGRLLRTGPLNLYKYTSHKLIRWYAIYWLVAAAIVGAVLAWRVQLLLPYVAATVLIVGLLLLGRLGAPVLRAASEVLWSFGAVGTGVVHSLLGRRYQTWLPPQSTR